MTGRAFERAEVEAVFAEYPPKARKRLLDVRELIFETAASIDGVGRIEEALRWGEPAYLTPETKSGSTIRIDWKEETPGQIHLFFHCQTTLVETFRMHFSSVFEFEGNRRLSLAIEGPLPESALSVCIAEAVTYHLKRKTDRRKSQRQPKKQKPKREDGARLSRD